MHIKGRFHPSRISGKQKFLRALEANKQSKVKKEIKALDLTKADWSLK